jgi:hypothetical protein
LKGLVSDVFAQASDRFAVNGNLLNAVQTMIPQVLVSHIHLCVLQAKNTFLASDEFELGWSEKVAQQQRPRHE